MDERRAGRAEEQAELARISAYLETASRTAELPRAITDETFRAELLAEMEAPELAAQLQETMS